MLSQADLLEWLCALGLPQYHKKLLSSGYDSMGLVADLTWEELQEIGVNKLGEPRLHWGLWPGTHQPPRVFKTFSGSRPRRENGVQGELG